MDDRNYPHIIYYSGAFHNEGFRYTVRDAAGWHPKYLPYFGTYELAVDQENYAHILIIYDGLRYLQQDPSGWSETGVISGTFQYAALALDDGGYAHASYYDVNAGALRYSYQDASGWQSEKIDDEGDPGKYTDITIDALGYPHISYHDNAYPGAGNLKYASLDDQGWHVQTVDTTYNTGFSTSIVLDSSGEPYISYHNDSTGDLLLAYPLTEAVYLPVVLNN